MSTPCGSAAKTLARCRRWRRLPTRLRRLLTPVTRPATDEPFRGTSAFTHEIHNLLPRQPCIGGRNVERRSRRVSRLHDEHLPITPTDLNLSFPSGVSQHLGKALPRLRIAVDLHIGNSTTDTTDTSIDRAARPNARSSVSNGAPSARATSSTYASVRIQPERPRRGQRLRNVDLREADGYLEIARPRFRDDVARDSTPPDAGNQCVPHFPRQ